MIRQNLGSGTPVAVALEFSLLGQEVLCNEEYVVRFREYEKEPAGRRPGI